MKHPIFTDNSGRLTELFTVRNLLAGLGFPVVYIMEEKSVCLDLSNVRADKQYMMITQAVNLASGINLALTAPKIKLHLWAAEDDWIPGKIKSAMDENSVFVAAAPVGDEALNQLVTAIVNGLPHLRNVNVTTEMNGELYEVSSIFQK